MPHLAATLDPPAGPDILGWLKSGDADVRRLERAKEEHHLREYLVMVQRVVPKLVKISELIETGWYELSEEQQRAALELRGVFDEALARAQSGEWNPLDAFRNLFRAAWLVAHEADLRAYIYAEVRFKIAVDRAIANESRRIKQMHAALQDDPEVVEALKRGEQEHRAGKMTRYTPEEFRQRFRLA